MLLAYAKSESAMNVERHVKLFRNGRNQAVRIPREFELPGLTTVTDNEREFSRVEVRPFENLL